MQDTGSANTADHVTGCVDNSAHAETHSVFSQLSSSSVSNTASLASKSSSLDVSERSNSEADLLSSKKANTVNRLNPNLSSKVAINLESSQSSNASSINQFQASQVATFSNPFLSSQAQQVQGKKLNEQQSPQKFHQKKQGLDPHNLNQNAVDWQELNQHDSNGAQDWKQNELHQYDSNGAQDWEQYELHQYDSNGAQDWEQYELHQYDSNGTQDWEQNELHQYDSNEAQNWEQNELHQHDSNGAQDWKQNKSHQHDSNGAQDWEQYELHQYDSNEAQNWEQYESNQHYASYYSPHPTSFFFQEDDYVIPDDWLEQAIFEDDQDLQLMPDLFEYELAALNACSVELQNNPSKLQTLLKKLKDPNVSAKQASKILRELLCTNGWFSHQLGSNYALRLGQVVMSQKICCALQQKNRTLQIIEAGTGVGKTYAYLLPLLLFRAKSLISTHTKVLQDQLVDKDLPNLLRLLNLEAQVSYCGLKGKANYLCHFKLDKLEPPVFLNHLKNYRQNNSPAHTKQYQTSDSLNAYETSGSNNADLDANYESLNPYTSSSTNGANKLPEHIMQNFKQEQEKLHQVFDERICKILLQVRDYLLWSIKNSATSLPTSNLTPDHRPIFCGEIDHVFQRLQEPLNLSDEDVALCLAHLDEIRAYFSCNASPCVFCRACFTDGESFICFYEQAYQLACLSDIAVVNHALMCSKAIPIKTVENSLTNTAQQSFIYQQLIEVTKELTASWQPPSNHMLTSSSTDERAPHTMGNASNFHTMNNTAGFNIDNAANNFEGDFFDRMEHFTSSNLSVSSDCILQALKQVCSKYQINSMQLSMLINNNAETWMQKLQQQLNMLQDPFDVGYTAASWQVNALTLSLEFLDEYTSVFKNIDSLFAQFNTNEFDATSTSNNYSAETSNNYSADSQHTGLNSNDDNFDYSRHWNDFNSGDLEHIAHADPSDHQHIDHADSGDSQHINNANAEYSQQTASASNTANYAQANTSNSADNNSFDDMGYKIDPLLEQRTTVVFDEAHELEKVFNSIYSQSLHSRSIQNFIQDLSKLKDRCGIEVPNLHETANACRRLLQTFMALEEGDYDFREFKYLLRNDVTWLQGFYDNPRLRSPLSPSQPYSYADNVDTPAKQAARKKAKSSSDSLIERDKYNNQPVLNYNFYNFVKSLCSYLQEVENFCNFEQVEERYQKRVHNIGAQANNIKSFLCSLFYADEQLLQQMYLPLIRVKLKASTKLDEVEAAQGSLFDVLDFESDAALNSTIELASEFDSLDFEDDTEKNSVNFGDDTWEHSMFMEQQSSVQDKRSPMFDSGVTAKSYALMYELHQNEDKCFTLELTPLLASSRAAEFFKILRYSGFTTILTSATLRLVNNEGQQSFNRIKERLGLTQQPTECCLVPSPFDYQHNALVWLPENFSGSQNESNFEPNQKAIFKNLYKVKPIINILHGGILVLTTKYSSIDVYAELLQQICPERKIFTQQKGVNIEHTVQEFIRVQQQEQQEAILVGTQSCWTGLNLQGRLLRLILIDKLPFDPPSLKQSLLKDMYYNGRQSTVDYFKGEYLPNMLLKLKQGSGRLIRSEQDWGVVVLMCNRIPKSYNNYVYRTFIPIPVIKDYNLTPIIEFVLNKQHAEQMSKSTLWSHFANTSRTK